MNDGRHRRRHVRFEDDNCENDDGNTPCARPTTPSVRSGLRARLSPPISAASTLSKYLLAHTDPQHAATASLASGAVQSSAAKSISVLDRIHGRMRENKDSAGDVKLSSPRSRFLVKKMEESSSASSYGSPWTQHLPSTRMRTTGMLGLSAEQRLRQKIEEAKRIRETKPTPRAVLSLPLEQRASTVDDDATRTVIRTDVPMPHPKPEIPNRRSSSRPTSHDSSIQVDVLKPSLPGIDDLLRLSRAANTIQRWWRKRRHKSPVEIPTPIELVEDSETQLVNLATMDGDASLHLPQAPPPVLVTVVTVLREVTQTPDLTSSEDQDVRDQPDTRAEACAQMWDDDELSFLEEGRSGASPLVIDTDASELPSVIKVGPLPTAAVENEAANEHGVTVVQDVAGDQPVSSCDSILENVRLKVKQAQVVLRVRSQKRRRMRGSDRLQKKGIKVACTPKENSSHAIEGEDPCTSRGSGTKQVKAYVIFGDGGSSTTTGQAASERNDLITVFYHTRETNDFEQVESTVASEGECEGVQGDPAQQKQQDETTTVAAQQLRPLLLLCDSPAQPPPPTLAVSPPRSATNAIFSSLHQVDAEVRRTLGRIQTRWRLELTASASSLSGARSTLPQRSAIDWDDQDTVEIGATPSPVLDRAKQREFLAALTEFQQSLRASIASSVSSSSHQGEDEDEDTGDDSADDDMDAELHAMLQEIQRCKEGIALARRGGSLSQPVLTRRRSEAEPINAALEDAALDAGAGDLGGPQ